MFIFVRSSEGMIVWPNVKRIFGGMVVLLGLFCHFSCADDYNPYQTPQTALDYALDSLYAHNYDAYIRSVAPENGTPILPTDTMRKLLKQHVEGLEEEKGGVVSVDVVDTCSISDSLYSVFYRLNFSTGESEVSSQTMQCTNGEWKIRIRNSY